MNEIWKNALNYEGFYQVSNLGRVKSLKRKGRKTEIIMKFNENKQGYFLCPLNKKRNVKNKSVHRLVIETFKGYSDLQCNHIDGNKKNNQLDNLEYCTCSDNFKHAYKLGLKNQTGEKNNASKLKDKDILFIRNNKDEYTAKELAKIFNISNNYVYVIINNKRWRTI